jgi:hypothetical protein
MKNTIEYRRLLADREQRANWRNWSLPEHRARGLQRTRRRLGLLPPRPRPQPRLPLERGTGWQASATATGGSALAWPCDPILKERLFGLTGPEGNHGEDVKEVYKIDAKQSGKADRAFVDV